MNLEETIKKQWPGFTVKCDKCGSEVVTLNDDRGWSEVTGPWGSVSLCCEECAKETDIIDN